MVKLVMDKLKPTSIEQYRKEVRSVIVKRLLNSHERYLDLVAIMKKDHIAPIEHVVQLRSALQKLTYNSKFRNCQTMGDIAETGLDFVVKNYRKAV